MREWNQLIQFARENLNTPMTMVTVVETEGSSYKKKGARKLILQDGTSAGLISGGCLEGAIIETAKSMRSDEEFHVFDTMKDEDRLFGYATGCQGKITIQFINLPSGQAAQDLLKTHEHYKTLCVHVVGAGADLDPLRDLLNWTTWNQFYYSTRTDLVAERAAAGWPIVAIKTEPIAFDFLNPARTALLLMSHSYPTDLEVLSQVVNSGIGYIGILGPEKRRNMMLADLKKIYAIDIGGELADKIHGPMGKPGFGEGESAIALSVVAQLQAQFFG